MIYQCHLFTGGSIMKKRLIASLILASLTLIISVTLPLVKDSAKPVEATYIPNQIPNGGFENGDLSGWTRIGIWKSESNLVSFNPERVVPTAYYGSSSDHPYNRDGNYHLGVYAYPYSEDNQNLNQERMGHLKSSTFLLGGSGWISFKMGGGKNTSVAYMSVHRADTHVEVARFGNRHFGNTTLSGTDDAEAYMFPYYYDLSVQIGQQLYILLTEAASQNWSVLSMDSMITYYPAAPTIGGNPPSGEYLAQDIKPVIYGVGAATNAISNTLSANVDNWEDPNNIFGWSYGRARTNRTDGDTSDYCLGAVRSPAFKINGANEYLTWDWEGNISLEKQLFVSIKAVGTNIELKRLVRSDYFSTKTGGEFAGHWTNLSALYSETNEYYVEMVDNTTTSWGLISVKDVYLRASDHEKVKISTDEAVSIEPLTTNFTLTAAEDAKSYGAYFLEATSPYCADLDGSNVPWTTLETAYGTLTADGKNYFVNSSTMDAEIVAARNRYVFLYQKYGSSKEWNNFVVSSTDTHYYKPEGAFVNREPLTSDSGSIKIIILVSAIAALITVGYLLIKKAKKRAS